jgi:hypothetical protein
MPSDAALRSMLGPMLEIGPRVLLVMACGLLALAAVRRKSPSQARKARLRRRKRGTRRCGRAQRRSWFY